jgi:hypothetical protein
VVPEIAAVYPETGIHRNFNQPGPNRMKLQPNRQSLAIAQGAASPDDDALWDDDEDGLDPEHPNWDEFDLDALQADDEPDPDDSDFWIEPEEHDDPWN